MKKNILKEYTAKVKQLKNAFQDLETNNLVPITHGEKSFTKENIKEVQDNLNNQEFTISVCGQINAGKSSFLNYLLFNEKEVLPADDTPWTAKLTTVRYGEENQATVTYYSQKEWELLKSQQIIDDEGVAKTYYDEFLKQDVNNAALAGLQVENYINTDNKIVSGVALNDLKDYVTKGGHKTPFVKQVDIKVNNELARGVVFVDTPGINDRNELRSKVTEDWIKKSCAVIYLFYAGQALSTADYEFIDQHLSSVPTDKILFALTKADISEDYEGAKAFVERTLKEDIELKKRKFITSNKSVYPISTLSALINYKQENNLELNEDEEFHLERITEVSPSFIKNNGFIEEFTDGLKSHLMTQTGKAIIDKATAFLFDIYKTNETSLQSDLNTKKEKLNDLELSDDELKQKKAYLDKTLDNIENFKKQFKRNTQDEFVARLKSNLKRELKKFRERGYKNLEKNLEDASDDSIKALRNLATHLTKQHLEDACDEIHNSLLNNLSIKEEINELLATFSNKFQLIIQNVKIYDDSLSCFVENPNGIIESISFDQLAVEDLKKVCGSNWGINKGDVKTQIFAKIKEVFESNIDEIIKKVLANVGNVIENNINEVYNNVNTEVKKIQNNANSLLESSKNYEEEKVTLQSGIVETQERLNFVKSHFKTLQECI
ncbi:dynamin family protein [Gillisia sp. CAL575]|uniref:dynamin family protein n=1 Tax=Gillisia sp. CAL575 TaxID=985255 RepID=UPI0003A92EE2|nr:dynamin family protein [Gillisia sp. CAL575]